MQCGRRETEFQGALVHGLLQFNLPKVRMPVEPATPVVTLRGDRWELPLQSKLVEGASFAIAFGTRSNTNVS